MGPSPGVKKAGLQRRAAPSKPAIVGVAKRSTSMSSDSTVRFEPDQVSNFHICTLHPLWPKRKRCHSHILLIGIRKEVEKKRLKNVLCLLAHPARSVTGSWSDIAIHPLASEPRTVFSNPSWPVASHLIGETKYTTPRPLTGRQKLSLRVVPHSKSSDAYIKLTNLRLILYDRGV